MGDKLEQCDQHHKDLYFGDHERSGLTTRVLILENSMKAIQFYGRWALLLMGGTFLTALATLVIHK